MSSETNAYAAPKEEENFGDYRSLSKAAVFSVVFAFLAVLGLVFVYFTVFGLFAVVFGVMALISIRRNPAELSGRIPATAGLISGGLFFVFGVGLHTMIYITEVPEGYERVSFAELQPEDSLPISRKAIELNGQQVFIKGYVHPGVSGQGHIKHFVLVRDMGTCCFGGQPKWTDMIEVTLQDPYSIRYSRTRRKLGGVLKVTDRQRQIGGIQSGFYQLDADYLK